MLCGTGGIVTLLSVFADFLCGWAVWSLSHNLGHRWWHIEMRLGKKTPYAHGEREHHRVYDPHGARAWQHAEDPRELFISFPLTAIAPIGLLFVAAYGWIRGWPHALPFAVALYTCMVADHQLHIVFHKSAALPGALGWFQQMHLIHHRTHRYNYFFVTGLLWDLLLGTARIGTVQDGVSEPATRLLDVP
jgi:hypothetical protein